MLNSVKCYSPIDDNLPTLIVCYFTISLFLFIPALNSCLNCRSCFDCGKFLLFIYLVAKIIILSIIVSILKDGLNKEWENNICKILKGFHLFLIFIILL